MLIAVWVFSIGIQNIKIIKSCSQWKHLYFKLLKYRILKLMNLGLQPSDLALVTAELLRKNNTNQSLAGLHIHYFCCKIHWNFTKLLYFWRRATLNGAENSILNSEFQCSMSTDKSMNVYFVPNTLVTHEGEQHLGNPGQLTLKGYFCEAD